MSTHTSRVKNMTLQEASIVSEQLMHLLQTVAEIIINWKMRSALASCKLLTTLQSTLMTG